MSIIDAEVFEQYADEGSFLWCLRDAWALDPRYDLASLGDLDERIEAQIDGLSLAGGAGRALCDEAIRREADAGAMFLATVLDVARGDLDAIGHPRVGGAPLSPALQRAVISGLGWAPFDRVAPRLPRLLEDASPPALRRVGIAAFAAHRRDPGPLLARALLDPDPLVRGRALRAAGEIGRVDRLPDLRRAIAEEPEETACSFWAAWSAALLGAPEGLAPLLDVAARIGPFSERACVLAMRRMDPEAARAFLRDQLDLGRNPRATLAGAAALGDPALVPQLLEAMPPPETARLAGRAFTQITGIDLVAAKLARRPPEGFSPDWEDPDAVVNLDPEESLPWPDPAAIAARWDRDRARFPAGTRFLWGKPITPAWLADVLYAGDQGARAAAALELATTQPTRGIFEVRAPARRQEQALGRSGAGA